MGTLKTTSLNLKTLVPALPSDFGDGITVMIRRDIVLNVLAEPWLPVHVIIEVG